jgi:hypothetical protein
MKYALLVIAALTVAGCVEEGSDLTNQEQTITVCLDGVAYWMINPQARSQVLAPRVDPKTLTFVRCDSVK